MIDSSPSPSSPDPWDRPHDAVILWPDGVCTPGYGHGAHGQVVAQLCFHTSSTGYQEILTDPSYQGQAIVFAAPHIGVMGANSLDDESGRMRASTAILRNAPEDAPHRRRELSLTDWLRRQGRFVISGVDTRAMIHCIRDAGPVSVLIAYPEGGLEGWDRGKAWALLRDHGDPTHAAVSHVATTRVYGWQEGLWNAATNRYVTRVPTEDALHAVVIDCGVKRHILRYLAETGARVTVIPPNVSVENLKALRPDALVVSNGPGDPAEIYPLVAPLLTYALEISLPIFGICLGHQLLALALGGRTERMGCGHRGANHPVRQADGRVWITSQNHGYAVIAESLPASTVVSAWSLFDQSVEAIACTDRPVWSVQYHPEAAPGPTESSVLLTSFMDAVRRKQSLREVEHA
jgi:carbamoyl-phosphate synthase small subunit